MFIAELNHPRFAEFNLKSLRTGIMAGSPCPLEVMRQVVERMGAREITIAYGMTEASPIITQTSPDDALDKRIGTVGRAIPGADVRIVMPGTMEDVPEGQPGELICRSHGVMKGYYNKPAETAAALMPDGWLRSGDIAVRTPQAYYRITGRCKDMIIRGGENIYPREIEEYLYTHAAIADVQVVGLPDEKMGEEICAWVKAKPGAKMTEDEVRDFCRGKIAHFKVPRYVVIVEEFPTTVTGKVQKFKLREMGVGFLAWIRGEDRNGVKLNDHRSVSATCLILARTSLCGTRRGSFKATSSAGRAVLESGPMPARASAAHAGRGRGVVANDFCGQGPPPSRPAQANRVRGSAPAVCRPWRPEGT